MQSSWFDTALSSSPNALPSLLAFADPSRITYGSDFPFAPSSHAFNRMLDEHPFAADERRAIDRTNAEALFPRLRRD